MVLRTSLAEFRMCSLGEAVGDRALLHSAACFNDIILCAGSDNPKSTPCTCSALNRWQLVLYTSQSKTRASRAHVCPVWTGFHLCAMQAQSNASGTSPLTNRLAVVARYREDVRWLERAPIRHVVVDKSWIPNVGGDASSYLSFILLNYHALPEWCLFMHAHEYHWHHAQYSALRSMRIDVDATKSGFLSISHATDGQMIWFSKDLLAELSDEEHIKLRRELLGLRTPYRGRVQHTPCGMFWVRRDRILARPLKFYQRLYYAMTNSSHALLGRRASGEGYPSRMLHVFFIEGYWHYIFGEQEDYRLPYTRYDEMPLIPLSRSTSFSAENEVASAKLQRSMDLKFPPLRLTYGGLLLHVRKFEKSGSLRNTNSSKNSKGSRASPQTSTQQRRGDQASTGSSSWWQELEHRSPRQMFAKVVHGCRCPQRPNIDRVPDSCARAADNAIGLLIRLGQHQALSNDHEFCGALTKAKLTTSLSSDAKAGIHTLQSKCFGGSGGARDYALSALSNCILQQR